MGIITDKLDEKWALRIEDIKKINYPVFLIKDMMKNCNEKIEKTLKVCETSYPTKDITIDAALQPIITDMIALNEKFKTVYSEFILWNKPVQAAIEEEEIGK